MTQYSPGLLPCKQGQSEPLDLLLLTVTFLLMAVTNELAPLDPAYVSELLSQHPFVKIPGVINVRDLGLYPSVTLPTHITKPGFVFRSAELSGITEEGCFIR